jgi:hypothetical protein
VTTAVTGEEPPARPESSGQSDEPIFDASGVITQEQAQAERRRRRQDLTRFKALSQRAKRHNASARRNNEDIDGLVQGVENGAVSVDGALSMLQSIRESGQRDLEFQNVDGTVVALDPQTGEEVNRVQVGGGSTGSTGLFRGSGAPEGGSQTELNTMQDVAEMVAPEKPRAQQRIVGAANQLRELGIQMSPTQMATVLQQGNASVGRDTGLFDFTGKDPEDVTSEDVVRGVLSNMTGYSSLEEFDDQITAKVENTLNAQDLPDSPAKTVQNVSAVMGQLMRGRSALPRDAARQVVLRGIRNPSLLRTVINNPDLDAEQKAEVIRQRLGQ